MVRYLETKWLIHEDDFVCRCPSGLDASRVQPVYMVNTRDKMAANWSGEKADLFSQSNHPLNEYGLSARGTPLFHRYQEYSAFLISAGRDVAAYERRAYLAYLAYDLFRAAAGEIELAYLQQVLHGIDPDWTSTYHLEELGNGCKSADAEKRLLSASRAFVLIKKQEDPEKFPHDYAPSEIARVIESRRYNAAWKLEGGRRKRDLEREQWQMFQRHVGELKEHESIMQPDEPLKEAVDEISWFLAEGRNGLEPATQWQLYAELIIQARYLHYLNRALSGKRDQGTEGEFIHGVLPSDRLCRYCGRVFQQHGKKYKLPFRCSLWTCKNAEERIDRARRRKLN